MIDWRPIATHPGDSEEILIYDGRNYSVAILNDTLWFAQANGDDAGELGAGLIILRPTHWAPLHPPA